MFQHLSQKERAVYSVLVAIFLFGAGYVGAQRLKQPPKIDIEMPKGEKTPNFFSPPPNMEQSITAFKQGGDVVVHVVGAVRKPGLQHLPAGSRIDDAVKAAGGATEQANLEAINLAAKLEDGQQVSVPRRGEADDSSMPAAKPAGTRAAKGGKHPDHPIDLSSASYAQMEELPGVGPSMAEKLMAYRLQHGHLSFEDLRAIPGLGPKKLEKIRPWVR